MLGCTARRAGLGIHRPQAGRRGSSSGRGWRVAARRFTTTPPTDFATTATASGRPRPGGAARVPALCRPGRGTTATAPGRSCGPGRGAPPSPSLGRRCGPVAAPRPGLRNPGGEPASGTVPGRRSEPGPVPPGPVPGRGPRGPLRLRTSRSAGRHSGLRGSGSPDWIATAGPGAARPDVRGGPVPGPGRPEATAEDAVHCAARAVDRVETRASRGAGSPGRTATAGPAPRARTQAVGPAPGPVSPRSDRRADVHCDGPAHRRCSAYSRRGTAVRAGRRRGPGPRQRGTPRPSGPPGRFSRAAGGVLTGPRPAPAAGLGRAGQPGDSDYAPAGAAGRAPRTAGAGRRQPEPSVKVSVRD
jgi:hypothetical protein